MQDNVRGEWDAQFSYWVLGIESRRGEVPAEMLSHSRTRLVGRTQQLRSVFAAYSAGSCVEAFLRPVIIYCLRPVIFC